MALQSVVVAVAVAVSAVYASWTLMPQAAQRALARTLLRAPLPAGMRRRLERLSVASGGCGCSGCDQAAAPKLPGDTAMGEAEANYQPLVFHARKPR